MRRIDRPHAAHDQSGAAAVERAGAAGPAADAVFDPFLQGGRKFGLLEGGGAEQQDPVGLQNCNTTLTGRSSVGRSTANSKPRWICSKGKRWVTIGATSIRPCMIQSRATA